MLVALALIDPLTLSGEKWLTHSSPHLRFFPDVDTGSDGGEDQSRPLLLQLVGEFFAPHERVSGVGKIYWALMEWRDRIHSDPDILAGTSRSTPYASYGM